MIRGWKKHYDLGTLKTKPPVLERIANRTILKALAFKSTSTLAPDASLVIV